MSEESRPLNYKTVKLSRGKHRSAQDGACIMELASMIAHEPFSDHPSSVSTVIASLLRAYNDAIDDDRRQDLYSCAAEVIGTEDSAEIERRRAEVCIVFAHQMRRSHHWWNRCLIRVRLGGGPSNRLNSTGALAIDAIRRHSDETHVRVLALVDELCSIRSPTAARDVIVARFGTVQPPTKI